MLQLISLAVLISTLDELFILNLQLRNISFYVFWSSLYFISLMQTLRVSLKWIIYIFLLFGLLFLLKWIWLINYIYVALISFIVVRRDFLMDWASFVLLCLWWSACKHRLLLQIINWSLWVLQFFKFCMVLIVLKQFLSFKLGQINLFRFLFQIRFRRSLLISRLQTSLYIH